MSAIASIFESPPDIKGVGLDESQYGGAVAGGQAAALGTLPQQQSLIDRLVALSKGQGPSLAQTLLGQATQASLNAGAGSAASTRGISPALAARLARLAQGSAVQQAAGQGAVARAHEQLGALGQTGQALAQRGELARSIFGTAGQLQTGQNSVRVNQNLGLNAAKQAQFQAQQGVGLGLLGGVLGGASSLAGQAGGSAGGGGGGGADAGFVAAPEMMAAGGRISGRAELAQRVMARHFGGMDEGGAVPPDGTEPAPRIMIPDFGSSAGYERKQAQKTGFQLGRDIRMLAMMMAGGGEVDMKRGGHVPGRARHPGRDTEANDTVPAMLTPGEGVVPLTKMADPDEAAAFARRMAEGRRASPRDAYLEQRRRKLSRGGKARRAR